MKIEMGESLTYTWLRHVCKCQIVQTNWKVSSKWNFQNKKDLAFEFMKQCNETFKERLDEDIFPQNISFEQVLGQGECDAVGIKKTEDELVYYGVDVAFHINGLGYGNYKENAAKVIGKCVRTAMCFFCYFGTNKGNVLFLSPKIQPGGIGILDPAIKKLNELFAENGFLFQTKIYYGDSFNTEIIKPVIEIIDEVHDSSELFLRSLQMLNLFDLSSIIEDNVTRNASFTNATTNLLRPKLSKRYIFGGNVYRMGRLALEIVKNYVGNNPTITYDELKHVFSQKLVFNGKPIVRRKSELSDAEKNGQTKRAYTNPNDLITVKDANDVCVSSQWSKEDMPEFLKTVRKLGFEVREE